MDLFADTVGLTIYETILTKLWSAIFSDVLTRVLHLVTLVLVTISFYDLAIAQILKSTKL